MVYQRMVSFSEAVKKAMSLYCCFTGRASRSEYWWFLLFIMLLNVVLTTILVAISGSNMAAQIVCGIVGLFFFLPGLGLLFRRLHDAGYSGWWVLLELTLIGGIVIFVFTLLPSQPFTNTYGEEPNMVEV